MNTQLTNDLQNYSFLDPLTVQKYKILNQFTNHRDAAFWVWQSISFGFFVALAKMVNIDQEKKYRDFTIVDLQKFAGCIVILLLCGITIQGIDFYKEKENECKKSKNKNSLISEMVKNILNNSITKNLLTSNEVAYLDPMLFMKIPRLLQLEFLLNKISNDHEDNIDDSYALKCIDANCSLESELKYSDDKQSLIHKIRLQLCGQNQELSEKVKKICHLIEEIAFPMRSLDTTISEVASNMVLNDKDK